MDHTFLFYHRCDDNMFETCVKTLRLNSDCEIIVASDNTPDEMMKDISERYEVRWMLVPKEQMMGRRAACKLEVLKEFVELNAFENDRVFVSDVDVYFMGDPFESFGDFDLGLTTRGYDYYFPINAGVFTMYGNQKVKNWLAWHVQEIINPTWPLYRNLNKRHRQRFGLDWAVGQDFLIACWEEREKIKEERGLIIADIGPKYNYCPPSDKWFEKAFVCIREAYKNKTHKVLHLKGQLKTMLYEGLFEHAVVNYPKCQHDWFGAGKNTYV